MDVGKILQKPSAFIDELVFVAANGSIVSAMDVSTAQVMESEDSQIAVVRTSISLEKRIHGDRDSTFYTNSQKRKF